MTHFTRRFLLTVALFSGVAAVPALGVAAEDRLRTLLADPAGAPAIGRAYLSVVPGEGAAIADLVLRSLGLDRPSLAQASDDELRGRLKARVRQDYAEGRLVRIGGWVLSRTEGRLAALWA